MRKKYLSPLIAVVFCFCFISCKKSSDSQMLNDSIEGSYTATGLFVDPMILFNTSTEIKLVSGRTYEATFPDVALPDSWKFQFDVDSSTNKLINWHATGVTYPEPQSGFLTADNPGGWDYSNEIPNTPGTSPWLQTTYNNTYDPSTKTFWMHYGYGSGAVDETGWGRQVYEKFVKQ